eukprot:9915210-Alexandrium_andersonii.AAC.1
MSCTWPLQQPTFRHTRNSLTEDAGWALSSRRRCISRFALSVVQAASLASAASLAESSTLATRPPSPTFARSAAGSGP